jgi:hypothetical protein
VINVETPNVSIDRYHKRNPCDDKASSAFFLQETKSSLLPLTCPDYESRHHPRRSAAARFRAKADPSIRVRGFIYSATASRVTANCGSSALQQSAETAKVFFLDVFLYCAIICLIHRHPQPSQGYPATRHQRNTSLATSSSPPPPWAR